MVRMKRGTDEVIVKGEMKGLRWLLSCNEADFVGCTGKETFKKSKENLVKELKERKKVSSIPIHQHQILKSLEEWRPEYKKL